jgi:protein disulfide-isomerase A6
LLGSPSLAPTKLDELRIKANILSSFAATKFEEAFGTAEEIAGQAGQVVFDAAKDAGAGIQGAAEKVLDKAAAAGERIKQEL